MPADWLPLTEENKARYKGINEENLDFLMDRYNKMNRWVIADMIRRSAYRYPDKPALIFGDKTLTYAGLEMESCLEDDAGTPIDKPGIPGEICAKGPHALIMYFKEPEKTEEAMKGGWFHSGDIGVMDADRYITVVDRKKDMIKTGGENVPSREVEEAIYLDKRVQEVVVIGLPDPKWVEVVAAVVVLKPGETMAEKKLVAHCRNELAAFKCPKRVIFADALPKTPTGKILRRMMRDEYKER
jgi:fatty-acyl-CoA synthase